MSFQLSPEAQAKLAARKGRYVESLKDKRSELERLAAPVLANDITAASLDPLREAVHKIAGSAGLYGFADLQEKAAELDLALLQVGGFDTPVEITLQRLIGELFAVFDEILPTAAGNAEN